MIILKILSLLFILIKNLLIVECNFVVCSSITIQGPISINKFNKIKNCSIVIGHVKILNSKIIDLNQTNTNFSLFSNLVEITDYLLIFQTQNLNNLEILFPKLSIIRGNRLFKNYALIIFLTNSLFKINLKSLIQIDKGSVLFSRLYQTCYINSIDWDYLLKDKNSIKPTFTLYNSDCLGQVCRPECKSSFNTNSNCWSEKNCQLKCSDKCELNCNLDEPLKCCSDSLCQYCRNGFNSTEECVSCSKYRDLSSGKCVSECSKDSLIYEKICIKLEDCSLSHNSLVQNYNLFQDRECIKECPSGYRTSQIELLIKNRTYKFQKCFKCDDKICKRDCITDSFHLKKLNDFEEIKNCFRVKSLIIELELDLNSTIISEYLEYLEEIDDYLLITRNRFLKSLNFFKRLKIINGKELFEKKFSLFVHTNSKLRDLGDFVKINFQILNGAVKFFENPELCYQEIETFMLKSNIKNLNESEVSFNFNGYRRITCSNQTIDLDFHLKPNKIFISWNITISDLRRLKGYILSYLEVNDEFNYDQYEIDFQNEIQSAQEDEWLHEYIEYDEKNYKDKNIIQTSIDVKPFTRYAVYVKADVTLTTNIVMSSNRSSFYQTDRIISKINYVYSLPAQPSKVESISFEALSYDKVNLKWKAPIRPNGIIQFYFIVYSRLKDIETFNIKSTDNCQLEQYLFYSNFDINIKKITSTLAIPVLKPIENNSKKCESKKKSRRIMDDFDGEKNDIISVEDEIYNLAFKPAKISSKKTNFNSSIQPIENFNKKFIKNIQNLSKKNFSQEEDLYDLTQIVHNHDLNLDENLLRIVKKDLFMQDDTQNFNILKTSNVTYNITISNLSSFGRYIVSVIACQNYTNELKRYLKRIKYKQKPTKKDLIENLKYFSVDEFCSKSNLITFRSQPDGRLDQIPDCYIIKENNIWYFKWFKPNQPNGFVYKYNLRFIDQKSNKTYGPLCHGSLENLKVALNQFLLTEGREYLIQVQAVTTAGSGPWSLKSVKYNVPSLSQYYLIVISQIIGVVVGLLIIFLVVFISFKKYLKSKEKGYFSIKSHYYYFKPDEWEIKRENLIIGERIGSGCFAEVHKGKLINDSNQLVDCAIKFCGSDHQSRQRLLKEANMMKSIKTTHIVKMLGVISKDNPAYLILEYMDKGDLKEYLKNCKLNDPKEKLTVNRLYRIAAEIADGMLWLSEHKYIHRDLAARNCLISKDDIIKISDLGLSKDIYQNPVYREKCKALLPIRWMAPESLLDGSSTTKSDVWSYGVVIWEMATFGDNPYAGKENEEVIQFVKNGGRLHLPSQSPLKFFTLINKCMTTEDYKRIGFKDVLDILDPDLTNDFKETSYYHNDFKKKYPKRRQDIKELDEKKTVSIKIADPIIGDPDNYM